MFVYGYSYGGYVGMPGGYTTGSPGFASLANYLSDVNYYTGYSYGGFSNYMSGGGWSPGTFYTYSPTNYMSSFWGGPAGFGYYFGYGNPGYAWGGPSYFGQGLGSSYGFDPYYGGYNPNHYDYLRNNQPSNQSNEQTNNNSGSESSGGSNKASSTGGSSSASEAPDKLEGAKPAEEKTDPKIAEAAAKAWQKDPKVAALSEFINKGTNGLRSVKLDSTSREISLLPYDKYGDLEKSPANKAKYLKLLRQFLNKGTNKDKLKALVNALPEGTTLVVGPKSVKFTEPQKLTYEELLRALEGSTPKMASVAKSESLPVDTPDFMRRFVKNFSGDGKTIGRPIVTVEKRLDDFVTKLTYLPDVENQDKAAALKDSLKLLAALKPFHKRDEWDNVRVLGAGFAYDKADKSHGEKFIARVIKRLGIDSKSALAKGDEDKGGGKGSGGSGKGAGSKQVARLGEAVKDVLGDHPSLVSGIHVFKSKNPDPDGAELESATRLCERYPNVITMDLIEDLLNTSDGVNNFPAIYARFEERETKYLSLLSKYWAGLVKHFGLQGIPFHIKTESGRLLSKKLPIDKAKEKLLGKAQRMKAEKTLAEAEKTVPATVKDSPKGDKPAGSGKTTVAGGKGPAKSETKLSAPDQAEIKYAERMCRRYKHFMSMDDKILQSQIKPDGVNNKEAIFNYMVVRRGIFEKPLKEFWQKEMARLGLGELKSPYLKALNHVHSRTLVATEAKQHLKTAVMKEYEARLATFWGSELKRLAITNPVKSWSDVWAIVGPKNWGLDQAKIFLTTFAKGMVKKPDKPEERLADKGSGEVPKLGSPEVERVKPVVKEDAAPKSVQVAALSTDGQKWLGKLAGKVKADPALAAVINTNGDGEITEEELLRYQLFHGEKVAVNKEQITFNMLPKFRQKLQTKLTSLRKEYEAKYKAKGFTFGSQDLLRLTNGQSVGSVSPEYLVAVQSLVKEYVTWMASKDGFGIGYADVDKSKWKQNPGKLSDEVLDVNRVLSRKTGACTEKTNFLIAALSLAGVHAKPILVYDQNNDIYLGPNIGGTVNGHVCASVNWANGSVGSLYDFNNKNYFPTYEHKQPVTMKQYLALLTLNRSIQLKRGSGITLKIDGDTRKVVGFHERVKFKQARMMLEWAHGVYPDNDMISHQLAGVYAVWSDALRQAGKKEEAISYMEKALAQYHQAAKVLGFGKMDELNDYASRLYRSVVLGKGIGEDEGCFKKRVEEYVKLIRRLPKEIQVGKLKALALWIVEDMGAEIKLLTPIVKQLASKGAGSELSVIRTALRRKIQRFRSLYRKQLSDTRLAFNSYLKALPTSLQQAHLKGEKLTAIEYRTFQSEIRKIERRLKIWGAKLNALNALIPKNLAMSTP